MFTSLLSLAGQQVGLGPTGCTGLTKITGGTGTPQAHCAHQGSGQNPLLHPSSARVSSLHLGNWQGWSLSSVLLSTDYEQGYVYNFLMQNSVTRKEDSKEKSILCRNQFYISILEIQFKLFLSSFWILF